MLTYFYPSGTVVVAAALVVARSKVTLTVVAAAVVEVGAAKAGKSVAQF